MATTDVNILAVIVAGVVGMFSGGLWYSEKMFGRTWGRENGPRPETTKDKHPASVFAISIALSIIAAYVLALWIGPHPSFASAMTKSLLAGACFVATSFGINYQFAGRSNKLLAIDAGYHIVQFAIFGVVLGLWP